MSRNSQETIGIVGGVGPEAGYDLARKILLQTQANGDSDHLPVVLISEPAKVTDRSSYLLGCSDQNPANAVFEIVKSLVQVGASVIGIPCNTMHAKPIFDRLISLLESEKMNVSVIHMIEQTVSYICRYYSQIKKVGLVCTMGTYGSGVYDHAFSEEVNLDLLVPDRVLQEQVHLAIYHQDYGLKACFNPVSEKARKKLSEVIEYLSKRGAEAIILGCTEIPLAFPERELFGMVCIDPTHVLARALIKAVAPHKLRT